MATVPLSSFGFRQGTNGTDGDMEPNFDIIAFDIQSSFQGADVLAIEIDRVEIVTLEAPVQGIIADFTTRDFDFSYNSFQNRNVTSEGVRLTGADGVEATRMDADGNEETFTNRAGGAGLNVTASDFNFTDNPQNLAITLRLGEQNTSETFDIAITDLDSEGVGDQFVFSVPSNLFSTDEFRTVVISLEEPNEVRGAFQKEAGNGVLDNVINLVEVQAPPTEFVTDIVVQTLQFTDDAPNTDGAGGDDLQITNIDFSNGEVTLTWTDTVAGAAYQVQRSTDLTDFSDIGDPTTSLTFTDSDLGGATRYFYRIVRLANTEDDN